MNTNSGTELTGSDDATNISPLWDVDFARAHTRLVRLCDRVYEVATNFDATVLKAAQIGDIRTLAFSTVPGRGRKATDLEWAEVEARSDTI